MWLVLVVVACGWGTLALRADQCCASSMCPTPKACPTGQNCCTFRPVWEPAQGGSCYHPDNETCASCPVYNPNHPQSTICPLTAPVCCNGCIDDKKLQCCHHWGSWNSWTCKVDTEICCGFGGGKTCCDAATEACAGDVCTKIGPAGCGGVCGSDEDCVKGGSMCTSCVNGPDGSYKVCALQKNVTPTSTFQNFTVSNKATEAKQFPSAGLLSIVVPSDGSVAAVEVYLQGDDPTCVTNKYQWYNTDLSGMTYETLTAQGQDAPFGELITNFNRLVPVTGGTAKLKLNLYRLSTQCTVSVSYRLHNTPSATRNVPMGGAWSGAAAEQDFLLLSANAGQPISGMSTPFTLGVSTTSGTCTAFIEVLGSNSGSLHILPMTLTTTPVNVQPGSQASPQNSTLALYIAKGSCEVKVTGAVVTPDVAPVVVNGSATWSGNTKFATGPTGGGIGYVASITQKYDKSQDALYHCLFVKATEGSCYVWDDISSGYIDPITPQRAPVMFNNIRIVNEGQPDAHWQSRLDFTLAESSDTCKGTATLVHTNHSCF